MARAVPKLELHTKSLNARLILLIISGPSRKANSSAEGGSQTVRALLLLREMLLKGYFRPGERIPELSLVPRVGVSRTPLRLALSKLEHEALLERRSAGGFVVRQFTLAEIHDAIEMRGVLEGTAARLAAERLSERSELADISACSGQIDVLLSDVPSRAAALKDYMALNERFHSLLLILAKSAMLRRSLEQILALPFASPNPFVLTQMESPEFQGLYLGQEHHRAILEAIENREGARAEALAREHARLARRNLNAALQTPGFSSVPGAPLIKFPEAV